MAFYGQHGEILEIITDALVTIIGENNAQVQADRLAEARRSQISFYSAENFRARGIAS